RYEHALRVLGLERGATQQAIKDAYRDLIKVWHPDRFGSDARLREKAQDKLKEVNAAFEQLRGYSPSDSTRRAEPARPQSPAEKPARAYRTPEAPPLKRAKSGRSRHVLMLVLTLALGGFVGTRLFMLRGNEPLPPGSSHEPIQASAPVSAPPAPAPARPQP